MTVPCNSSSTRIVAHAVMTGMLRKPRLSRVYGYCLVSLHGAFMVMVAFMVAGPGGRSCRGETQVAPIPIVRGGPPEHKIIAANSEREDGASNGLFAPVP